MKAGWLKEVLDDNTRRIESLPNCLKEHIHIHDEEKSVTPTERRIAEIKDKLSDRDSGYYPLRKEQCSWLLSELEKCREALAELRRHGSPSAIEYWCWCHDFFRPIYPTLEESLARDGEHVHECCAAREALGL